MSDPQKIVAYCDLLGFSKLVVKCPDDAKQLLSDFYNFAQRVKVDNSFDDLELFLFSDFLFVQGKQVADVVNYMCKLYRRALLYSENSDAPMLMRGGVARGGVVTQQRQEALQVRKNYIVSPALTHAAAMEKLVKGQRLLISGNEREEMDHFWNDSIHAVCYDQPSLKPTDLFKTYRYQDLLWSRDLSLDTEASRAETMQLITIAARLYRGNSRQPKRILAHYAETLRICLLSYSELLEPGTEDREFVKLIVNETLLSHPNSTVWLGFLECVLLSRDAFAFHEDHSMKEFFRYAVLSKCWAEVSVALEQPEHHRLRSATEEFIGTVVPCENEHSH